MAVEQDETPRRARLAPRERCAQILTVAIEAFEHQPLDEISFETLGPRAGVSPALLRHYFGTRRELFRAAVDEALARLTQVLRNDRSQVPPAQRPAHMLTDTIDTIERYPWALHLWLTAASDPELSATVAPYRDELATIALGSPIAEASPTTQTGVYGWIGLLEAVVSRHLNNDTNLPRDEIIALILRATIVFTGR
jgi:AcrR family transcriptional regulator